MAATDLMLSKTARMLRSTRFSTVVVHGMMQSGNRSLAATGFVVEAKRETPSEMSSSQADAGQGKDDVALS